MGSRSHFNGKRVTFSAFSRDGREYTLVETEVALDPKDYLTPGWNKVGSNPFPTFTTSRCSDKPGRRPAGIHQCASHELDRWKSDWHRFPPYQYMDQNCVQDKHGNMRVVNVHERECILGFPLGYTQQCLGKQFQGKPEHIACQLSLLGNTWSVPVIAWLLGHFGHVMGLHPAVSPAEAVHRCAPGAGRTSEIS